MIYTAVLNNIRVVDGDTIVADIDLGWDITLKKQSIRFYGIDTPEVHNRKGRSKLHIKAGLKVKGYVERRIGEADTVKLYSVKEKDKFGRKLGHIILLNGDIISNLNEELLDNNFANPYIDGKRKSSWTENKLKNIIKDKSNE